jgi:hypothetical protein
MGDMGSTDGLPDMQMYGSTDDLSAAATSAAVQAVLAGHGSQPA